MGVGEPGAGVLEAFGVVGAGELLEGGKGETWRFGEVVLKPAEGDEEIVWRAGVLAGLPEDRGFRVARSMAARDGRWVVGGWEASRFVAGHADPTRVDDVVCAGEAFHRAIAHLPRPSFLDGREDAWTYADRLAWAEPVPAGATRPSELLGPLLDAREPVDVPAQVVHGDLLGNVLFAAGLPPAIIDWPAYWRPPAWAAAVTVVDAMCWHGADPGTIDRWSHLPHWRQMLIRALIYRIATHTDRTGPDSACRPVIRKVLDHTPA